MSVFFRACLFALIVGPLCANAAPSLKGIYKAGELGLLDLTVSGGKVVGKFRTGGSCNFSVDEQVISGSFEGNVFVGSVSLCQTGQGCTGTSTVYPLMAIYASKELAGEVTMPRDCQSPGLVEGHRFSLTEASAEDKAQAQQPVKTLADKVPKNLSKKEREALAAQAFKSGSDHFYKGRYFLAADAFELAMSAGDESWGPVMMLGVCRVKVRQWKDGKALIDRGLKMGGKSVPVELRALAGYALAVVAEATGQRADAWGTLQKAILLSNQPMAVVAEIKNDPDLKTLRDDPQYPKFIEDLEKQIARNAKKPKGG